MDGLKGFFPRAACKFSASLHLMLKVVLPYDGERVCLLVEVDQLAHVLHLSGRTKYILHPK